jgi:hypothetical protein
VDKEAECGDDNASPVAVNIPVNIPVNFTVPEPQEAIRAFFDRLTYDDSALDVK